MALLLLLLPAAGADTALSVAGTLRLSATQPLCSEGRDRAAADTLGPDAGSLYWELHTAEVPVVTEPRGWVRFLHGRPEHLEGTSTLYGCGRLSVRSSWLHDAFRAACVYGASSAGAGEVRLVPAQGDEVAEVYELRDVATSRVLLGVPAHAVRVSATGGWAHLPRGASGADVVSGTLVVPEDGNCLGGRGLVPGSEVAELPVIGTFSVQAGAALATKKAWGRDA